jgi:hypothetical protein
MTTVLQAVNQVTQDSRLRSAMLLGGWLESGQNAGAVGDHGTSFGPWQIHTTVHPDISPTQAEDPAAAAAYMEPAYAAAAANVPASLWSSDPEKAAEETAYGAERPSVDYYTSAGAASVDAAWQKTLAELNGQDLSSTQGFAPIGGSQTTGDITGQQSESWLRSLLPGGGLDTPGKILQGSGISVSSIESDVLKMALLVLFVGTGAVLVILGLARATGASAKLQQAAPLAAAL